MRKLPRPSAAVGGHKYGRGHAVIVSGGPLNTGAARLAAAAALTAGAGLVTLHGTREALAVHAAHVTAIMLSDAALGVDAGGPAQECRLHRSRRQAWEMRRAAKVLAALASGASVVLDADALTSFREDPDALFRRLPHRLNGPS